MRLEQTPLGSSGNAFVFLSPSGKHACELWVETGCGGFSAIPCEPCRFGDPNAVFSEKAKTIPHLTRCGPAGPLTTLDAQPTRLA